MENKNWLELFYQGDSNNVIAQKLKMGRNNLIKNYIIPHFGFNPANTERLFLVHKKELDGLIHLYQTKTILSFKDVCKTSKLNYLLISKYFKRNGIKVTQTGRDSQSYIGNHNVFSNIDNELSAYLLGFFLADGHLEFTKEKSYCIRVGVAIQDSHILHLFKKGFNAPKYNIRVNSDGTASLAMRSFKVGTDLVEMGVDSHKTTTLHKLPDCNKEVIHHMIRGYFDGDGCMSVSKRLCGNRLNGYNKQFSIASGNRMILEDICKYMNLNEKCIYHKPPETLFVKGHVANFKDSYYISIRHTDIITKIYNYLYKDSTYYFKRKKDKFELAMLNSSQIDAVLQGDL